MAVEILREWDRGEKENVDSQSSWLSLELGCGNGHFITAMGERYRDRQYVAVDRRLNSLLRAARKVERQNLSNVKLINGDIFTVLDSYFVKGSLSEIFINFPDPWVKRRHLKKRVVGEGQVRKYFDYLKAGGRFYFVTDNEEYRDSAINTILESGLFTPCSDSPYYQESLEGYPVSLYELKWRKLGRGIFYATFLKKVLDYKE